MYPFYSVLENEIVDIKPGWKMYACTMWTDFNNYDPLCMHFASTRIADHFMISLNGERDFKPTDAYDINKYSTSLLVKALEDYPDDNFIVMTHHTPSLKSSHPKWGGPENILNYVFHNTNLEDVIASYPRIKYWVHGHTHDSFNYMIGDCNVLCNPRGYYRSENNPDFSTEKYFEV